jgi:hypothetical protein
VGGGRWLVVGGWWLVVGGWWLVGGGWWVVGGGWWVSRGRESAGVREVCGLGVGCPVIRSHEFHGDQGAWWTVGLTRSREAAKGATDVF